MASVILILALVYIFYNYQNKSEVIDEKMEKSIAVLYFDNMSGEPEQEYFSDGMTKEIIARISKIEDLTDARFARYI